MSESPRPFQLPLKPYSIYIGLFVSEDHNSRQHWVILIADKEGGLLVDGDPDKLARYRTFLFRVATWNNLHQDENAKLGLVSSVSKLVAVLNSHETDSGYESPKLPKEVEKTWNNLKKQSSVTKLILESGQPDKNSVTDWINETSKNWLKKMEKLGSCYVLEIEHGGKTSIYEVFSTPRYPHPGAAMIVKIEYSDNNSFTQDFKKNYSAVAKLPGPTLKRNTVYLGVFRIKHKNSKWRLIKAFVDVEDQLKELKIFKAVLVELKPALGQSTPSDIIDIKENSDFKSLEERNSDNGKDKVESYMSKHSGKYDFRYGPEELVTIMDAIIRKNGANKNFLAVIHKEPHAGGSHEGYLAFDYDPNPRKIFNFKPEFYLYAFDYGGNPLDLTEAEKTQRNFRDLTNRQSRSSVPRGRAGATDPPAEQKSHSRGSSDGTNHAGQRRRGLGVVSYRHQRKIKTRKSQGS